MANTKRLTPATETIKMLLLRSGNQCAFPGCNHVIFNDNDKLVSECCHIEAALPGGERFNSNQTDEERRSIENLLFLCHKHHVETDDVAVYTVEKLKEIKLNHENSFKENPPSVSIANMNNINKVLAFIDKIEATVIQIDNKQDAILTNQEKHKSDLARITEGLTQKKLDRFVSNHFISEIDFSEKLIYYIPRKLYTSMDWHLEIKNFNDLISYQQNKEGDNNIIRTIVIADGGVGKTTFLQHWALEIANYGKYYPVYISLRDCKSTDVLQDYIYRRHPDMVKIANNDHQSMVFLLDGFDEIGDSGNAIKQINDLSRTFPDIHILLTCRRNSFFNQITDFDLFLLSEITNKDIALYIQNSFPSEKIDCDHFFEEIVLNNFQNLVYNPFYLKILIKSYIENNKSLKISKKDLIDKLLAQRKDKDKIRRPDLELGKRVNQRKNEKYGLMIAFCMALMNQRSLSEDDLLDLLSEDGFNMAIDSLPIKKSSNTDNIQYWDFEHNIFLEHLAASVLKGLSFEQIIEYTTSEEKVNDKWKDILAHLLGILDMSNAKEDDLCRRLENWLVENEPKLLFNLESSQITSNEKSKIFIQAFQEYQEKALWIDTYDIDSKKMALFGESEENVQYVFSEISNTSYHWRRRANAALIFKEFSFNSMDEKTKMDISKQYVKAIMQADQGNDNLLYYLITSFPFCYEDDINDIVKYTQDIRSARTRSALYHIIGKNDLQDKYIQILLSGLSNRNTQGNDGVSFNVSTGIKLSLMKLKEADSYVAFFSYLASDINSTFDWFQYSQDEVIHIMKKGITFLNDDILVSLVELVKKQCFELYRNSDIFNLLKENENIRISIVDFLIDSLRKETESNPIYLNCIVLAFFLKNDDFQKILSEAYPIEIFRYLYLYVDKSTELGVQLKKHLKDKFDHEEIEVPNIWDLRRKAQFDIHFEPERFTKECLELFDNFIDNKLDPYQLLTDYHSREGSSYNLSIIQFLRRIFGDGKKISKKEVSSWINKYEDKFFTYLNDRISEDITNSKEGINLSPTQMEFIKQWYYENIKYTNFNTTFDPENKDRFYYAPKSVALIRYMQKFDLDCPDDRLCEMLNRLDDNFDYIIAKIKDNQLLIESIMSNLVMFREYNSFSIKNQIIYALKNKITDAYPLIIEILKDDSLKLYKNSIIITWMQNNLPPEPLLEIKTYLNQNDLLVLCKELIFRRFNHEAHSILLDIIKSPIDEKIRLSVIDLLIWLKDPLGLQLSLDYSIEKGTVSLHDPFYGRGSPYEVPDNYLMYDDISIYPLLNKYLELSFSEDVKSRRGRSRKIEGNIKYLASLSEENYQMIIISLRNLIDTKIDIYKDIEDIYFLIEDIIKEYRENHARSYNLDEAKEICEKYIH